MKVIKIHIIWELLREDDLAIRSGGQPILVDTEFDTFLSIPKTEHKLLGGRYREPGRYKQVS